ncbi:MAG: hypothetical protein N2A42_10800, partial [Luteolibacter sp.]
MTNIAENKLHRATPDRRVRNLCVVLATTVLIGSCTIPVQTAYDDATYMAWRELAEDSAMTAPPAPEFPAMPDFHGAEAVALESSRPDPLPQIPIKDMVITRAMDVGVLLRALADAADLNIIITSNVSGPVLVSLRRETRWDRLFLAITEAHGLHY